MQERSDKVLILAIQNGDIFSFEHLVKRYQRGLYIFAFRIVQNEAIAEEVVQDALFNVYRTIDRVDPERKFSTYLFEIVKHTAISAIRSRKHTVSLDLVADAADDEVFFERFLREEEASDLRKTVAGLPEKYRRVITLYYFDEMSYEEISTLLHLPINTVRTHLRRAKKQLKNILYEHT